MAGRAPLTCLLYSVCILNDPSTSQIIPVAMDEDWRWQETDKQPIS